MVEDVILLKNNERESLEAELRVLRSKLQANTSDVGDWKIIKALEYQLVNEEIPYDITELNKERQAIRDRINEIDIRLAELEGEINELMVKLAVELEGQRETELE